MSPTIFGAPESRFGKPACCRLRMQAERRSCNTKSVFGVQCKRKCGFCHLTWSIELHSGGAAGKLRAQASTHVLLTNKRKNAQEWSGLHARSFGILSWSGLLVLRAAAQQTGQSLDDKYPENPTKQENAPSRSAELGRLPIEWIIGPYIPVQARLEPLTNTQRWQIYMRQTFLTAGHTWPGGFQRDLTRRVVNPATGAAAFLATADVTQHDTDSL